MKPVKVRKCYCVCLTVDFVSLFLLCRQQYNQRVLNNLWRTRLSLRRMLCLSPVRKLDGRHTGRPKKGDNLLLGEGEQRGGGATADDGEKALCSINHSVLSGYKSEST
jgi:hypothetical protein